MLPLSAETGPTSGAFRVRHDSIRLTSIGSTKAGLYRIGDLEDRGGSLRAPIPVVPSAMTLSCQVDTNPWSRTIVNASSAVKASFILQRSWGK